MKQRKVPQILIEQYRLGELSQEKAREVEKSPDFHARLSEIETSDAEIRVAYPASRFAERIRNQHAAETSRRVAQESAQARDTGRSRRTRTLRWLTVAVPGAAALIIGGLFAVQTFVTGGSPTGSPGLDDTVRIKGNGPELSVYRSVDGPETSDDEAERLEDGSVAYPGDRLQLAYNSGDREYGAIVSVDGRGAVFVHYPYSLSEEPRLVPGRRQQLVMAYQLDDAPRFEHFYFITSDHAFSVEQLVQTIRSQANQITERADSLGLSDEFEITSFTIEKGE